jgi:hypothetical protein
MRINRYPIIIAGLVMCLVAFGTPAMAFHSGGVAHCDGCHTMHNSVDGEVVRGATDDPSAVTNLLAASDASSVCLSCHADAGRQSFYHVLSQDGSYLSPGGDFFWTTIDIEYVTHSPQTRNGYSMGHSINARDFADRIQTEMDYDVAPGGSFPAELLGCQSCHNPHGTKFYASAADRLPIADSGSYGGSAPAGATLGSYRLLGDRNYSPTDSGVTFVNSPPVAVSIREPRASQGGGERDDNHAAYGSGTSEWCANCHTDFLVGNGNGKHPAGNMVKLGAFVGNYNSYIATGSTTGDKSTAYLALVPIERGVATNATLATDSTVGATAGQDNVTCLTCHRAHASAFEYSARWDLSVELLAESHPAAGDTFVGGTPAGDPQQLAYYGRDIGTDFNEFQRSLCNKCHLKD